LSKRNRVIGTRRTWTLAVLVAILSLECVAYVRYADNVQRGEAVANWFNWTSVSLYEWVITNGVKWLRCGPVRYDRIVLVDLADGSIERCIYEGNAGWGRREMLYSPQARTIIGLLNTDGRIELINVQSGKQVPVSNFRRFYGVRSMMLDHIGRTLYTVGKQGMWTVDVSTGAAEKFSWPKDWAGSSPVGFECSESPRMWVCNHTIDATKSNWITRFLAWDLRETRFVDCITVNSPWRQARVVGGRRLLQWNGFDPSIIMDLQTGIERRMEGNAGGLWSIPTITSDGRLLIAYESQSRRFGVFDLDTAQHVATLQHPISLFGNLAVSPDRRIVWAAIIDGTDGISKIAVFDISDLTSALKPEGDSASIMP
jgi:hypothetical protein